MIIMRVVVECRDLVADLILFDVIMGTNRHYAMLNYREKMVIFKIPNDEEFRFRGDKSSMP